MGEMEVVQLRTELQKVRGPATKCRDKSATCSAIHKEAADLSRSSCRDWPDTAAESWLPAGATRELRPGTLVRYRVALPDAWRGVLRRSPLRVARVTEVLEGRGATELMVVLELPDGSNDFAEVSSLLELHVNGPIRS